MGFAKPDREKEFIYIYRQCSLFLDAKDFDSQGNCPECGTDEDLFINELEQDDDLEDDLEDEELL